MQNIVRYRRSELRQREIFNRYMIGMAATFLFAVFALIAFPISEWFSELAKEQRAIAEKAAISVDIERLKINEPKIEIVYQYETLKLSWLYKFWWNWLWPFLLLIATITISIICTFAAYEKSKDFFNSNRMRSFSILSIAASVGAMVFTSLKYTESLLDQEVIAYIAFSSFMTMVFFISLFSYKSKLVSGLIYIVGISLLFLVSWFTKGSPISVISEFRILLSSLLIPYQAILFAGTTIPILLVIAAIFKTEE